MDRLLCNINVIFQYEIFLFWQRLVIYSPNNDTNDRTESMVENIFIPSSKGKITPVPQLVPNLCSFILFIYVHKYYSIHALMYVAALAIIQFWGGFVGCLVSRLHGLNGPMSRIDIRSI